MKQERSDDRRRRLNAAQWIPGARKELEPPLSAVWYCPDCGRRWPNSEVYLYCPDCGAELE